MFIGHRRVVQPAATAAALDQAAASGGDLETLEEPPNPRGRTA